MGFRAFVVKQAEKLSLTGYVRNMPDGHSVEAVAEKAAAQLDLLLAALRKRAGTWPTLSAAMLPGVTPRENTKALASVSGGMSGDAPFSRAR